MSNTTLKDKLKLQIEATTAAVTQFEGHTLLSPRMIDAFVNQSAQVVDLILEGNLDYDHKFINKDDFMGHVLSDPPHTLGNYLEDQGIKLRTLT